MCDFQGQVVSIASGKLVAVLIDSNEKHSPQHWSAAAFAQRLWQVSVLCVRLRDHIIDDTAIVSLPGRSP